MSIYDMMAATMVLVSIIAAIDIYRVLQDMWRPTPRKAPLTFRTITPQEWERIVWLNVTEDGEPENYMPGPARIGQPERKWDANLLTVVKHEVSRGN